MEQSQNRADAIRDEHYLSIADSEYSNEVTPGLYDVERRNMAPLSEVSGSPYTSTRSFQAGSGDTDSTFRQSMASYQTPYRQSLEPAPLSLNRAPGARLQAQLPPIPPARVYGDAAGKVKQQFGVDDVATNYSYLNSGLGIQMPPPPPPRTFRSSWKRLSLTPGEMPYPISLIRARDEVEHNKAEQMLGLRRQSRPPPVPPKDPRRMASTSTVTSDSLPLHKKTPLKDSLQPLNGRTAWLHALTGMLVVFNCWGLNNAYGLFQAYYERDRLRGTSPSSIAWIGSTQLALVFGLGVPVGRLVDKGYFRLVFHGGSVIMVFGLLLSSVCNRLWSLWLVNGLITGIGMGMSFCSGIVALMTWFDERKVGSAMGLGAAGSCIGGMVYVLLARHFLATKGYKTTMLVLGAFAAVTMIPPNLVFRVRGQTNRSSRAGKRGSRVVSEKPKLGWRTFAEPSYLLAAGGLFFAFLGVYFGFVYMVSFASNVLHLSDTAATNLLIFMLAANLPGRFLPALISDRCIGPLNTIIPSVFLSSGVIWLWTASGEHRGSLTVIACFYGFVSAGIQVLYAPTVYSFCLEPVSSFPTSEATQIAMDRIGIKAGGIFTIIGFGCLIGLPIGGALISYRTDRNLSQPYLGAQIFAGICLLLGGSLLLASRVKKSGWAAKRA